MSRDFKKHLQKQLKLLQKASNEYDYGDTDEAINIAIRLRVLLHDKGQNISLLTHLKQKSTLYFISTLETIEETRHKFFREHRIVINQDDPPAMLVGGERKPPFGSWGIKKYLPFDIWWNEKILKINDKEYSRADIVLTTTDKEGGAHIDKKVNQKTKLLETGTGRVKYGTGNGDIQKELVDTHYLFLRQIAYEVLLIEKLFILNGLSFNQPACETITYNGLLQESEKFLDEKQTHRAKSCLEKAIKYDPFRKEAYNNIGNIYQDLDDVNEAILNYIKAIELDKDYVDAQNNLGDVYCKQQRYALALDLYDNILLKNPDVYKVKHNRNYILLKLKEKKVRLFQYHTFLDESTNKLYLQELSFGLFEDEEFDKAYVVFEKILNIYGENALLLSNMVAALIKLKDYGNVKKIIKTLMKQENIKNVEVYFNVLEYMLAFDQNLNFFFMKRCEEFFTQNEIDIIYLDIFKILLEAMHGENMIDKLSKLKEQLIAKNITYDFNDLLVMSDYNNLNDLKSAIKFLTR